MDTILFIRLAALLLSISTFIYMQTQSFTSESFPKALLFVVNYLVKFCFCDSAKK